MRRLSIRTFLILLLYLSAVESIPGWLKVRRLWSRQYAGKLDVRGGQSPDNCGDEGKDVNEEQENNDKFAEARPKFPIGQNILFSGQSTEQARHSSSLILDVKAGSSYQTGNSDSIVLRQLISSRSHEYLTELQHVADLKGIVASNNNDSSDADSSATAGTHHSKLPHPRRLLHFLAPKVPAIKQSPDVSLRIHSARSDIDSGVAACIIGTIAHACERYDKERRIEASSEKPHSAAAELTTDRRFEQLVECVLSGVNVKKRKRESLQRRLEKHTEEAADIEEILDEEDLEESDGLTPRDACRAAWGIAILGAHHSEELGGEKVLDLLLALSLRIRELLLARLQLLRKGDLLSEPAIAHLTVEERLDELAGELAQDAALSMWTFACVRACTGLRSVPLFETCCSILCQDPVDLRRRAQEVDEDNEADNIGSNDVIDRLARSEGSEEPELNVTKPPPEANKDALLDWLSQIEVNDVLWALALHGSSNTTSSSDDITLSETAAALREIAFDRLVEWLEDDLNHAELQNEQHSQFEAHGEEPTTTIEVVDAAALLESESKAKSSLEPGPSVEKLPVENMTLRSGTVEAAEVEELQVVDAAALLASAEGESTVAIETETMMASRSTVPQTSFEATRMSSDEAESPSDGEQTIEDRRLFAPHDLASVAWSVTELRDPLRLRILPTVIKLIAMLGEAGTSTLSGADLANLAWAVARFEAESFDNDAHTPRSFSLSIMSWITNAALKRVTNCIGESDDPHIDALEEFQPPELGRLLWAVASVMSSYTVVPDCMQLDENVHKLARITLKAAASNLSLFATEDLLRICWAFLELCGSEGVFYDSSTAFALGKIRSTVEESLHRWERGDCSSMDTQNIDSSLLSSDTSVFSSFFGKSRIDQAILEQMVGDHGDEDDTLLAPIIKKSRRPMLRDLSVDPSTLCKAACAFQRLFVEYPEVMGGWTLTRVAIRLLSSRDARLMKECSIHDIVRLCEAAVRSDAEGHGRELIMGLFAHKVVQVLNDVLTDNSKTSASSIQLSAASPAEIAILISSLGELGVKHSLPDESRHKAYKRLRLVMDQRWLTVGQLKTLTSSLAVNLLKGLVLMKYFSSDPDFLLSVLKQVKSNALKSLSTDEICKLAETLAFLKEALETTDSSMGDSMRTKVAMPIEQEEESLEETNNESKDEVPESPVDELLVDGELGYLCGCLLNSVAAECQTRSKTFHPREIRRILSVYSLLPFKSDDLIDCFDKEIAIRIAASEPPRQNSIEKLLKNAKEKGIEVNQELFEESGSSRLEALKNGIMSLFRSSNEDDQDENSLSEELATMIQHSINSTVEAATAVENMRDSLHLSIDKIGRQMSFGSCFELGRCEELIANYRRVEFSTGTLRSRYDKEWRKDLSKRVLSRLLP